MTQKANMFCVISIAKYRCNVIFIIGACDTCAVWRNDQLSILSSSEWAALTATVKGVEHSGGSEVFFPESLTASERW